jgi:3-hydroxyisobutyrate dehydrogenase-like beta-hydroxyacid dehydrogenase
MIDSSTDAIGFIGLGVMGAPMCRHLAVKSGRPVIGHDLSDEPFAQLAQAGVTRATSSAELAERASVIFVSLPSGRHLEAVCYGAAGLLAHARAGQTVIDLGTSPLDLTRRLADEFAAKGVRYADAPVARTRAAAEAGTLAITVGADSALFAAVQPLLFCFAAEVTHCGPVGAGQIVKILNNMVVVGTVVALSEAAAIAAGAGIDTAALFETFVKGSADSFALRNHGLKAIAAGEFPERVFSTDYMHKDMGYALAMAADAGVTVPGAEHARRLLERASSEGHGAAYWPIVSKLYAPPSE